MTIDMLACCCFMAVILFVAEMQLLLQPLMKLTFSHFYCLFFPFYRSPPLFLSFWRMFFTFTVRRSGFICFCDRQPPVRSQSSSLSVQNSCVASDANNFSAVFCCVITSAEQKEEFGEHPVCVVDQILYRVWKLIIMISCCDLLKR